MDHNYYKERISAYADHALPPYEKMAVEGHLATCAECRAALAKVQKLSAWIGAEGNLGGDDYFEKQAQAIEERLGIAQTKVTPMAERRTWRGLGWKLTAAAASIALAGILAFYTKDSIWQKTDQPVMSPSTIQKSTAPASDSQSEQSLQKQAIPAPQIESEARSGAVQSKKTVKTEEIDSLSSRLPDEDVIAPEADIKLDESQSNYKSTPQMLAPAQTPLRNVPKETKLAKPVELKQTDTAAVVSAPQADRLLRSVAGVKAKGDSGVVIRGGQAGEVEYIVDGVPISDPLDSIREKDKGKISRAKRDVSSKSEVSQLQSETKEQMAPALPVDSLDYWRRVRASLGEITFRADGKPTPAMLTARPESTGGQPEKIGVAKLDTLRAKAAGLIAREVDDAPKSESIILRACFNIARLSSDSTEVADVRRVLFKAASDPKSLYRSLAQSYLDSLGVK